MTTAAVARVDVRCTSCGGRRSVTTRTRARILEGVLPSECSTCRRMHPTEAGMRWWVRRFGDQVPVGMTVATYVRSNGLPDGLQELIASVQPTGRQ